MEKINFYFLGKSKFLFGSNHKVTRDTFFKYTVDTIISVMNEEVPFDNILIDIFRVSNEKFTLDYVSKSSFTILN